MTRHTSKACGEQLATIPEGYEGHTTKGAYQTIANTKCYITGPRDARKAVYVICDVFGCTNTTFQGADVLAINGKEPYLVIVPDLFDGKPFQREWLAERAKPEDKQKSEEFMSRLQDPQAHVRRILKILKAAKQEFPGVESWARMVVST